MLTYYFVARTIKLPEEQLHFFEYGLVGIFFLRALQHSKMPLPILFFSAWAISSTTGWCDELLQGITPNRHYDIRDIGFNVIAAGLGLLVYLICKKTETRR
jgi:VanZ family protein